MQDGIELLWAANLGFIIVLLASGLDDIYSSRKYSNVCEWKLVSYLPKLMVSGKQKLVQMRFEVKRH